MQAQLGHEDAARLRQPRASAVSALLNREQPPANLVGIGVGVKWSGGAPTGTPALLALVKQKVDQAVLAQADVLPGEHEGVPIDVVAVGEIFAGAAVVEPAVEAPTVAVDGRRIVPVAPFGGGGVPTLTRRMRPARGGFSVGHKNITAGTITTGVYDILPGGSSNPPHAGIGAPRQYYILSNNHVLANSNAGIAGDAVLQPGPYDGGADPADRIAVLTRFIPIEFFPPVPLGSQRNLVDCALAGVDLEDIDRDVYWVGQARGWRLKSYRTSYPRPVSVGTEVQKTGRTSGWTTGTIVAVDATIDVGYGGGRTARFQEQIVTTPLSAPGDSGSLVLDLDNVAVGLLFAGSPQATICNQIENVRSLLGIEVAQAIL
jgi:hypothetical protein